MWHHLFLSNKQVQGVFGDAPPDLERAAVCELLFKTGNPAKVYFSAYVECSPERFPEAWRAKGFDSVQFRFSAALLIPPRITGIPVSSAEASIKFGNGYLSVNAHDASWSFEGEAILEHVFAEPFENLGPGHDHNWLRPSFR